MQFFVLPHCCVARIHKVASSSLACAIVTAHYPHLLENREKLEPMEWQALAPQTENPKGLVFMLVRHPVERFLSAIAMLRLDIDTALTALRQQDDLAHDVHLVPQSHYKKQGVVTLLYRFPRDLERFCNRVQLPYPLPHLNAGQQEIATPSHAQIERIEEYYAHDLFLYLKAGNA